MTAIDRAFIRAYETDEEYCTPSATYQDVGGMPATVPMPHINFPPEQAEQEGFNPDLKEETCELESTTREEIVRENLLALRPVDDDIDESQGNSQNTTIQKTTVQKTTGRRPLSTFVPPQQTQQEGFKPALEVDVFRWSTVCDRITNEHHNLMVPTVDLLITMADQGRSLVGFLAAEPDAGCTSLALCVARLLASMGKTVAIVDGKFYQAEQSSSLNMAGHLGVAVTNGWEDVLVGQMPLAEGVIRSLGDGISILPLAGCNAACDPFPGIQASVTAGVLRYHFDIVLFDLGCAADEKQAATAQTIIQHCRLDTTLVVTSLADNTQAMQRATAIATSSDAVCLGVLENKCAAGSG